MGNKYAFTEFKLRQEADGRRQKGRKLFYLLLVNAIHEGFLLTKIKRSPTKTPHKHPFTFCHGSCYNALNPQGRTASSAICLLLIKPENLKQLLELWQQNLVAML
ncbi:hypothetical protein [Chlorogloeopsis fritschii]|uniref:hypothetical protein n=1 Tax=Chlorogloeopsis fritschii TaxID=1124 RepID=UPI0012FE6022|nr:hypothetical protein [Chlorogloeopsis fritschii]